MKKIYLLAFAVVLLAACNNEPSISLDVDEIVSPCTGGDFAVKLTSPNPWTAVAADPWVTVDPSEGEGSADVTIKIESNKEEAESTSRITFTSGKDKLVLPVVRQAYSGPMLLVTSDKNPVFSKDGGVCTIKIQSDIRWSASSNASWATVNVGVGQNNGVVMVTVAPATIPERTTANITIAPYGGNADAGVQVVTITRGASDETSLDVNPRSVSATCDGGDFTVQVNSTTKWKAEVSFEDGQWITLNTKEGDGDGMLSFSVAETYSAENVTGIITIKEVTSYKFPAQAQVAVSREGRKDAVLTVTPTSIDVPCKGGVYSISVKTQYGWKATVSTGQLSLSSTSGSTNANVVLNVQPNENESPIFRSVTFTSDKNNSRVVVAVRIAETGNQNYTPKAFSVSKSRKVYFSQGNLQYQGSTKKWRFALNQWDFVGGLEVLNQYIRDTYGNVYENGKQCDNAYISDKYTGWIDLFGWGTRFEPYMTSELPSDYNKFYDWGDNRISNGGDEYSLWRTLTATEWEYLLTLRPNAFASWAYAVVNDVCGLLLLPDEWEGVSGITINKVGMYNFANYSDANNNFTSDQFTQLEAAGAVFLPAAGERHGIKCGYFVIGSYWTSEESSIVNYPYLLTFNKQNAPGTNVLTSFDASTGLAVRLIKDVK